MGEPWYPEIARIARWLELAEADGIAATVRAAVERGQDGLAVHELGNARLIDAGAGSELNRVYGWGFDGEADRAVLDRVEALFEDRGRPSRIELSPYAHAGWLPMLQQRGYGVEGFRDVLFRALGEELPIVSVPGLTVREIDARDPDEVHRTVELVGRGFWNGAEPPAVETAVGLLVVRSPRARTFVASLDGVPAGAATLVFGQERVALLGGSTLPEHRRRGVQGALIAARLAAGRAMGARLATVQASPGIATRRNAERLGFRLAYTRVTLVRALGARH